MGIQNFPAQLQPIIQQNFLEREFQDAITSVLGYRDVARREPFPNRIGETISKTRPGLKTPVTTPMNPSANTNLDNGLTPASWTVEQYTIAINQYGDTIDLNIVADKVGLAGQFLQNAKTNGIQSKQSVDRIARNTLFNAYLGGNTRVLTTLGAAAATIHVDDIRGFPTVMVSGQMVAVSGTNPMNVTVGSDVYSLVAATADATNVSSAAIAGGISGTLAFASNVTVADGTTGNTVVGAFAPRIIRPNGRLTSAALANTDLFSLSMAFDAVAQLRNNGVPPIDGFYEIHLDPTSCRQLFADPDFKLLFQGATDASNVFRMGRVIELADLRFKPTTEAYVQPHPTIAGLFVRRPIVCGEGSLVEGDFDGMPEIEGTDNDDAILSVHDGIVQVTREPIDRLHQIIAQSWYWIGGFSAPTDQTVNTNIVPTASPAYFKRAITLEHVG